MSYCAASFNITLDPDIVCPPFWIRLFPSCLHKLWFLCSLGSLTGSEEITVIRNGAPPPLFLFVCTSGTRDDLFGSQELICLL